MAVPVLPESAPFTPAQRAWLNGFFAGSLSLDLGPATGAAVPGPVNGATAVITPPAASGPGQVAVAEAEEDFPWHDPTLPLDERLKLAEGQPIERRLMAAMAQLDCGSCGYVCKTYAEAIASGAEQDLTKCTPGGKDTFKQLKAIMAQATPA